MTGCGRARATRVNRNCPINVRMSTVPKVVFGKVMGSISRTAKTDFSLLPRSGSTNGFIGIRRHVPIQVRFANRGEPRSVGHLHTKVGIRYMMGCWYVRRVAPFTVPTVHSFIPRG